MVMAIGDGEMIVKEQHYQKQTLYDPPYFLPPFRGQRQEHAPVFSIPAPPPAGSQSTFC